MPILDERHDFAHPVEGDSAWSESYYFNAYDPVSDSGIFTRIGVRPNEGTMDVGFSVWLPGDRLAHVLNIRECDEMTDSDLSVGGVTYERVEPLKVWELRADADAVVRDLSGDGRSADEYTPAKIRAELRFEALTPAIGVDGQGASSSSETSASTSQSTGKGHLEQAGRWTGWVEADGARFEFVDARGNRDKSWGPRRWGGPQMWRWFSINVGDDFHMGGIRIGTEAGDLHRGWVWDDGEAASIRDWSMTTEVGDDGFTHRALHLAATDKLGRVHELDGEVLRVAPIRNRKDDRTTLVNEGLTRWTRTSGSGVGDVGHGIAEYLHQLDDDDHPIVAVE